MWSFLLYLRSSYKPMFSELLVQWSTIQRKREREREREFWKRSCALPTSIDPAACEWVGASPTPTCFGVVSAALVKNTLLAAVLGLQNLST